MWPDSIKKMWDAARRSKKLPTPGLTPPTHENIILMFLGNNAFLRLFAQFLIISQI